MEVMENSFFGVKLNDYLKKKRCLKFLEGRPCSSKCIFIHKLPIEDEIVCKYFYFHMKCDESSCIYLHSEKCSEEIKELYHDELASERCRNFMKGLKCSTRYCKKIHKYPKDDGIFCLSQINYSCIKGSNCNYLHIGDVKSKKDEDTSGCKNQSTYVDSSSDNEEKNVVDSSKERILNKALSATIGNEIPSDIDINNRTISDDESSDDEINDQVSRSCDSKTERSLHMQGVGNLMQMLKGRDNKLRDTNSSNYNSSIYHDENKYKNAEKSSIKHISNSPHRHNRENYKYHQSTKDRRFDTSDSYLPKEFSNTNAARYRSRPRLSEASFNMVRRHILKNAVQTSNSSEKNKLRSEMNDWEGRTSKEREKSNLNDQLNEKHKKHYSSDRDKKSNRDSDSDTESNQDSDSDTESNQDVGSAHNKDKKYEQKSFSLDGVGGLQGLLAKIQKRDKQASGKSSISGRQSDGKIPSKISAEIHKSPRKKVSFSQDRLSRKIRMNDEPFSDRISNSRDSVSAQFYNKDDVTILDSIIEEPFRVEDGLDDISVATKKCELPEKHIENDNLKFGCKSRRKPYSKELIKSNDAFVISDGDSNIEDVEYKWVERGKQEGKSKVSQVCSKSKIGCEKNTLPENYRYSTNTSTSLQGTRSHSDYKCENTCERLTSNNVNNDYLRDESIAPIKSNNIQEIESNKYSRNVELIKGPDSCELFRMNDKEVAKESDVDSDEHSFDTSDKRKNRHLFAIEGKEVRDNREMSFEIQAKHNKASECFKNGYGRKGGRIRFHEYKFEDLDEAMDSKIGQLNDEEDTLRQNIRNKRESAFVCQNICDDEHNTTIIIPPSNFKEFSQGEHVNSNTLVKRNKEKVEEVLSSHMKERNAKRNSSKPFEKYVEVITLSDSDEECSKDLGPLKFDNPSDYGDESFQETIKEAFAKGPSDGLYDVTENLRKSENILSSKKNIRTSLDDSTVFSSNFRKLLKNEVGRNYNRSIRIKREISEEIIISNNSRWSSSILSSNVRKSFKTEHNVGRNNSARIKKELNEEIILSDSSNDEDIVGFDEMFGHSERRKSKTVSSDGYKVPDEDVNDKSVKASSFDNVSQNASSPKEEIRKIDNINKKESAKRSANDEILSINITEESKKECRATFSKTSSNNKAESTNNSYQCGNRFTSHSSRTFINIKKEKNIKQENDDDITLINSDGEDVPGSPTRDEIYKKANDDLYCEVVKSELMDIDNLLGEQRQCEVFTNIDDDDKVDSSNDFANASVLRNQAISTKDVETKMFTSINQSSTFISKYSHHDSSTDTILKENSCTEERLSWQGMAMKLKKCFVKLEKINIPKYATCVNIANTKQYSVDTCTRELVAKTSNSVNEKSQVKVKRNRKAETSQEENYEDDNKDFSSIKSSPKKKTDKTKRKISSKSNDEKLEEETLCSTTLQAKKIKPNSESSKKVLASVPKQIKYKPKPRGKLTVKKSSSFENSEMPNFLTETEENENSESKSQNSKKKENKLYSSKIDGTKLVIYSDGNKGTNLKGKSSSEISLPRLEISDVPNKKKELCSKLSKCSVSKLGKIVDTPEQKSNLDKALISNKNRMFGGSKSTQHSMKSHSSSRGLIDANESFIESLIKSSSYTVKQMKRKSSSSIEKLRKKSKSCLASESEEDASTKAKASSSNVTKKSHSKKRPQVKKSLAKGSSNDHDPRVVVQYDNSDKTEIRKI